MHAPWATNDDETTTVAGTQVPRLLGTSAHPLIRSKRPTPRERPHASMSFAPHLRHLEGVRLYRNMIMPFSMQSIDGKYLAVLRAAAAQVFELAGLDWPRCKHLATELEKLKEITTITKLRYDYEITRKKKKKTDVRTYVRT